MDYPMEYFLSNLCIGGPLDGKKCEEKAVTDGQPRMSFGLPVCLDPHDKVYWSEKGNPNKSTRYETIYYFRESFILDNTRMFYWRYEKLSQLDCVLKLLANYKPKAK